MKMKIKSLNEKKDDVLQYLPMEIDCGEQNEELAKMIAKDGYIKLPQHKQDCYNTTLEGDEFLRKGGYKGRARRKLRNAALATILGVTTILAFVNDLFGKLREIFCN